MHQIRLDRVAVIVAHQMEHAVRDEQSELESERDADPAGLPACGVDRDHDLAYQPPGGVGDLQGKRQHIRSAADAAEGAVEAPDLLVVHEGDVSTASASTDRPQREPGGDIHAPATDGSAPSPIGASRPHYGRSAGASGADGSVPPVRAPWASYARTIAETS